MRRVTTSLIAFSLLSVLPMRATAAKPGCTYKIDPSSVQVSWTAFKTSQKVGVKGGFKKVEVKGPMSANSLAKLVTGVSVVVDRTTVDTANPDRDKTLFDFFFSKLSSQPIVGKFKKFSEADKSAVLALELNGQTHEVPMKYVTEGETGFIATGDIDLLAFQASAALESLNKKCFDLHKGSDGVSKTWSDVSLTLKGQVSSTCK